MAAVVFCSDPLVPRNVDPDFTAEFEAARAAGCETLLIPFEDLIKSSGPSAKVRQALSPGAGVYRGWMLRPAHYERLYDALAEQGLLLMNDPTEYAHTHHFPNSYPLIAGNTPFSVSMRIEGALDLDVIQELLAPFGSKAIMVKDFVKSEKHDWLEACFIPDAADKEQVARVVRRFLELRGAHLNEGLVFREFVPLAHLADHPTSGMPMAVEFRLFFANGALLSESPYWEAAGYAEVVPPLADLERIARNIRSRFFSMDIAQRADGGWTILELGDGQVSGLPPALDPQVFYQRLHRALNTAT